MMSNKLLVLWVLILLLTTPAVALSDCLNFGRVDNYYIKGAHMVIFYEGMRSIAKVEIPYCTLYENSNIRLTRTYTCENDKIIVDGAECMIGTVSSVAAGSF
jgi:hypothetical protein